MLIKLLISEEISSGDYSCLNTYFTHVVSYKMA